MKVVSNIVKFMNNSIIKTAFKPNSFVSQPNHIIMENTNKMPENNSNTEGYKVPGDGNVPNELPEGENRTFEENHRRPLHTDEKDIPGQQFNINDKAYFDSSKEDFIKTVSNHKHASPKINTNVDLSYKTPDGDR